jgi:NAD(P)-dependent dehydrogenase (short-subunit alcohol dehydrogenase family)
MTKQDANQQLAGRIALITGAAGLLGAQHAHALLSSGGTVVLTDVAKDSLRNASDKLSSEYGRERVAWYEMDVTDHDSIVRVHQASIERFGAVNVLINNAAVDPKVGKEAEVAGSSRFECFSLQQWDCELRVGLTGAFLCSQVFGQWMAKNGGGVILNIASDLSVIAPDQRLYRQDGRSEEDQSVKPVTYSVIKTGLIGLTRYLAAYWAGKHVRVNALSPGGVYVGQPEEFVARLTNLIPLRRMAAIDEYRGAVQFLCSDASRYMTGQNLVIDGGRSIL